MLDIGIVWLRQDLRLSDNPALYEAAKNGQVIALYVLDEENNGYRIGSAQKWWLHNSLKLFKTKLEERGIQFILRKGNSFSILKEVISSLKCKNIYWNRCYEPQLTQRDSYIKEQLIQRGIDVKTYASSLIFEPWKVKNEQNSYYKVFTPFWRKCLSIGLSRKVLDEPKFLPYKHYKIKSDSIDNFNLLPKNTNWHEKFSSYWKVGELAAQQKLNNFIQTALNEYSNNRDIPSIMGTSKLSPHLHFGEISPNQIWDKVKNLDLHGVDRFLSEIGWREFSYYLLHHFPELPYKVFNKKFSKFPWHDNDEFFEKWKKGNTGYPIIDAGMRELWHTGWMHNRVRMIVASFLTKNLLISWQKGADWFFDTLLDADLANNSASWQWVAGSGADAAPYFRIFNPITQATKFDYKGEYIRKWVPELKELDDKNICFPNKNINNYPLPIVDLKKTRNLALDIYSKLS